MTSFSAGAGVSTARKFPAVYTKVNFGASPNINGGGSHPLCMLGNKTSAGSATANTEIVGPLNPALALSKFGPGELYLGSLALARKAPDAVAYAIAQAESAGSAATATLTVANAATGSGEYALWIHGVAVRVSVTSGQAAAAIGPAIKDAINGTPGLCATATIDGTNLIVTISFRHKGTRGNLVTLFSEPESSITGTAFTLSAAALSGGTTPDTVTTAMATAASRDFEYYALASVDTTALQAVQTQITTNAGALVRKRSQVIYCTVDSLATATTQAETLNDCRMQGVWHYKGDDLPICIAAAWAGIRQHEESLDPNVNLSLFNPSVVDLYPVAHAPHNEADYMVESDANTALDVGLTPLVIRQGDKHPLVALSITTHSNDASGAPDTRTLTTNMVTVPDRWARAVEVYIPSAFPAMYLVDDPLEGDDPLPPKTITPLVLKGHLIDLCQRTFAERGYLKGFAADAAAWACNIDASNANRADITMGIHPAPWFTQASIGIDQLSA